MKMKRLSGVKYHRMNMAFFLLLISFPKIIFAKTVDVYIYDCDSKEPISDVQIYTESQKYLGITNKEGKARLAETIENIYFRKLGYEPLMLSAGDLTDICLIKKSEELSEVLITTQKANFYDTLIQLRNQNKASFLDFDALLTYSFKYKTITLHDNAVLDEAEGYFTVRYKKGYVYPNLFANTDEYAKVVQFRYQFNKSLPSSTFEMVRYLNPSSLLCCYDMMEKKFDDREWWNYRNIESGESTKYFMSENDGRKFATYTRDGELSKYFHFDSSDMLEKIEIFRPVFFYKSNFTNENADFYVSVNYTLSYPRVANKYIHTYEVKNVPVPYKTVLEIDLAYPQEQTLIVQEDKKRNIVFSLIGSFYEIYQEIEASKKKR